MKMKITKTIKIGQTEEGTTIELSDMDEVLQEYQCKGKAIKVLMHQVMEELKDNVRFTCTKDKPVKTMHVSQDHVKKILVDILEGCGMTPSRKPSLFPKKCHELSENIEKI
jgi:hypothetical protein